jgi:hypothetical protein
MLKRTSGSERRGAMILRTLSSSKKYRRLSLLAKAALPLLLAWSDDQGRIELDPEELKMRALQGLRECDEEQVPALFEEYAEVSFGLLYEFEPGRRALQWKGWHDAQTLRNCRPSAIPAPDGWQDNGRRVTEEEWYQRRERERQLAREVGVAATKGERPAAPPPVELHPTDEIEMLRGRYTPEQLQWIDEAVSAIRTVKPPTDVELAGEYRCWDRFPPGNVASACQTFVVKLYHTEGRGFEYLRGIVKRWESGEQAPRRRETKQEQRTAIVTMLLNQGYQAPKSDDVDGLKKFKTKLVDLLSGDRHMSRISALQLVKAVRVEEWYGLEQPEIERRVVAALKEIPQPEKGAA